MNCVQKEMDCNQFIVLHRVFIYRSTVMLLIFSQICKGTWDLCKSLSLSHYCAEVSDLDKCLMEITAFNITQNFQKKKMNKKINTLFKAYKTRVILLMTCIYSESIFYITFRQGFQSFPKNSNVALCYDNLNRLWPFVLIALINTHMHTVTNALCLITKYYRHYY